LGVVPFNLDLSQAEKEITVVKSWETEKMTIFTPNGVGGRGHSLTLLMSTFGPGLSFSVLNFRELFHLKRDLSQVEKKMTIHCKPIPVIRVFLVKFFQEAKPIFIKGIPAMKTGLPVMKTGFSLWEKLFSLQGWVCSVVTSWSNAQNDIYFTQNGQSCHFEWKSKSRSEVSLMEQDTIKSVVFLNHSFIHQNYII
jgi:hypothetical protein